MSEQDLPLTTKRNLTSVLRRLGFAGAAITLAISGAIVGLDVRTSGASAAGEGTVLSADLTAGDKVTEVAGDVTIVEPQAGTSFAAGTTAVALTISEDRTSPGGIDTHLTLPAPSITGSAGYTVDPATIRVTDNSILFDVKAEVGTNEAAKIVIAGIQLRTGSAMGKCLGSQVEEVMPRVDPRLSTRMRLLVLLVGHRMGRPLSLTPVETGHAIAVGGPLAVGHHHENCVEVVVTADLRPAFELVVWVGGHDHLHRGQSRVRSDMRCGHRDSSDDRDDEHKTKPDPARS